MQRAFKRLERVLNLESKQGYKNKAVVGGIRQFAAYWVEQAREVVVDEADRAFVEQTAELLMEYGRLSGVEARQKAVQTLLQGLQKRQQRVADLAPAAAAPAPKPRRQRPPEPAAAVDEASAQDESATPEELDQAESEDQVAAEEEPEVIPPARPEEPAAEPDPVGLAQSVIALKGIGPSISDQLGKLGVETIGDLLYLFPRRYDDYTLMKPINQLRYGDQVTVIGTIWETRARRTRGNQVMVQSVISDGTGSIQATWFNQPWLSEKLKAGTQIVLSGKIDQYLGRPVMSAPEWEALEPKPVQLAPGNCPNPLPRQPGHPAPRPPPPYF